MIPAESPRPVGTICRVCKRIACADATHAPVDRRNRRKRGTLQRWVYDSARWARVRIVVFVRDNFACQQCGAQRPDARGLVCDHIVDIVRLVELGRDPFDVDECQTLCRSCSGVKDGGIRREAHSL